jgi:hypothetical protein
VRKAWLALPLLAVAAVAQKSEGGRAYSFSSMKYLAQDDDITGWDVSVVTARQGFEGVLYCGLTDVQGPVRFRLDAVTGKQVVRPENTVCGTVLTLDFRGGALYVEPDRRAVERVPRHTNFLSEDKFQ